MAPSRSATARSTRQLLALLGELRAQRGEPLPGRDVVLCGQCHFFDLHAAHQPLDLIDLTGRESISMRSREPASSTRSIACPAEPRGDVPVGQGRRRGPAGFGDPDTMVDLVALFEPAQDTIVSSTEGSPTSTCWKRAPARRLLDVLAVLVERGRADIRSSPRASMGLIMLPASMAPSPVAPAPTMVCSSSMKVMTCPAESVISLSTALSRSSNSPRNFAPATIDPRSSAMTRLPRNDSRHVTAMTRWARPSTMAVFAHAGLTDQYRVVLGTPERTCTTRRILGVAADDRVELPGAARWVRSTPYFSSALNVPFRVRAG